LNFERSLEEVKEEPGTTWGGEFDFLFMEKTMSKVVGEKESVGAESEGRAKNKLDIIIQPGTDFVCTHNTKDSER
jgi:hypothetical protein